MKPGVATFKQQWALSLLWTNIAVAVADLFVFIVGPAPTLRSALHILVFTFIYANLTSVLALLLLGWFMKRIALRKVPPWIVVIPAILVFTATGCLLGQTFLAAIGMATTQYFWTDFFHTLRFAMPLALVFGLGAMSHGSLLARVQTMELQLHEKELAEERTHKLAAETRLRSLESWIHPHFLFNTLNSISALVASNPARAEQIIGRLATLLRASLDSSNHSLIPLRQELAMVESYADIEKVRFGDKLRASVDIPAELQETKVPTMSVQSLVENAVKHGITPQPSGGEFRVTARAVNNTVHIEIRDSGPGFDLAAIPAGHGLDKLVQRLDALYGPRASLSVSRHDGYSLVEMIVPRV
ncbi:MAG: sensor histidine kinase [Acidobacteriaceae bacterium]